MNKVRILDIDIDNYKPADLIAEIVKICLDKTSASLRMLQVNPEIIVATNYSQRTSELVKNADYAVANGVGMQWAAKFNSTDKTSWLHLIKSLIDTIIKPSSSKLVLPELFNSSSFTEPLLSRLSEHNLKVLVAASPKKSDIKDSLEFLSAKFEGLDITGFDSSDFTEQSLLDLIKLAKNIKPDLVLLGIGFPLQERVAEKLKTELNHGMIITEGGTFDYEAFGGKIKRAPKLMQKVGLEWLFRLVKEPSRFKRQLSLLEFIKLVYRNKKSTSVRGRSTVS